MKKQLLSLVVMALAITGLTAQTAPTNNSSWKDQAGVAVTENNNVFEIATPLQLTWLAQQVNAKTNTFAGKTVKLISDIDLSAYYWQPIGGGSKKNQTVVFDGTFDGNKKCIKGLFIDLTVQGKDDEIKYAGFIGSLGTNGIIKDLGIVSGEVSDAGVARGAFVGYSLGLVENCYNKINVSSISYAGGLVGDNAGIIKTSYNTGTIAIVAGGSGYAGGIAGNARAGEISACYNAGTIKAITAGNILFGGIAPTIKSGAGIKITACYNTGTIVKNTATGSIGGLVATPNDGTIIACFNDNGAAGTVALGTGNNPAAQDVTADVLKNEATLTDLNTTAAGACFKADQANLNGGYPILINNAPAAIDPTPTFIVPIWENSRATNKMPLYFDVNATVGDKKIGDNVRCLAYGKVGGKGRLYVVEGKALKIIHILDAATGVEKGTLSTTNVETTGVKFNLVDIEVSEDGKIFAASMAMAAGQKFIVYMWANETAEAVKVLEFDCKASRIGDLFSVTGDYSKGTAKIYAATAAISSTVNIFSMENGTFKTTPTTVLATGRSGQGVQVSVAAKSDGSMYWCAAQVPLVYVNENGIESDKTKMLSTPGIAHASIKYLGYNEEFNKDLLAVFEIHYDTNIAELATIISTTPGDLSTANVIGRTTSLGTGGNAGGTGDVAVSFDEKNDPTLYVLSTNNGLGAYKVLGLGIKKSSTSIEAAHAESSISFFPNPATDIINFTQAVAKVSIFSIAGQLVKEEINVDNVNISGLNGNYIMKVTDQEGLVATKRLMVK